MLLKLKAIIYRYTGIFLAHKEEQAYLNSFAFKKDVKKYREMFGEDKDIAEDIAAGTWHADHGFYRPLCFLQFNKPTWFWKPIDAIVTSFRAIKLDLQLFIWKLRKK